LSVISTNETCHIDAVAEAKVVVERFATFAHHCNAVSAQVKADNYYS